MNRKDGEKMRNHLLSVFLACFSDTWVFLIYTESDDAGVRE